MLRSELLLLPLLTAIVFCGDYLINTRSGMYLAKRAVHEASWWSVGFFICASFDLVLCLSYLL